MSIKEKTVKAKFPGIGSVNISNIRAKQIRELQNSIKKDVCKRCGGNIEYKPKEGYVCRKCSWTKLFAN